MFCEYVEELTVVDQVGVIAGVATEMFSGQLQAEVSREPARTVTEPARVGRLARIELFVDDAATQLGVVGP